LGGLAEVELWPAAPGEAKGSRPHPDRHRAEPGHAKAKSGHGNANSGDERATSGKPHTADKDRKQPQSQHHDQAKSSQHHKPDPEQGKDRNKGQERKKETAKFGPKRAPRGRGS